MKEIWPDTGTLLIQEITILRPYALLMYMFITGQKHPKGSIKMV